MSVVKKQSVGPALLALALIGGVLGGCASTTRYSGMFATDEARIWVLRTVDDRQAVYRCADTTAAATPPRPVCVQAPFVETAIPSQ